MPHTLAQGLGEDAVGVADGAPAHPSVPVRPAVAPFAPAGQQGAVPCLDVAGGELLDKLAAEVRDDVALDQPDIALRRLGRDRAGGLPLLEAGANMIGARELARIDVPAVSGSR